MTCQQWSIFHLWLWWSNWHTRLTFPLPSLSNANVNKIYETIFSDVTQQATQNWVKANYEGDSTILPSFCMEALYTPGGGGKPKDRKKVSLKKEGYRRGAPEFCIQDPLYQYQNTKLHMQKVLKDRNNWFLGKGMDYTTVFVTTYPIPHLRLVHFTFCKLYLNFLNSSDMTWLTF